MAQQGAAEIWSRLGAPDVGRLRLLLVRHGESVANQERFLEGGTGERGDCLTEKGKEDARQLAQAIRTLLAQQPLTGELVVASSSMRRAVDTAEALLTALGLGGRVVVQGLEEMHYGSLEGRPLQGEVLDEIRSISSSWHAGDTGRKVGESGESPVELQERALVAIGRMLMQAPGPMAVCVAHSWVNKALICAWKRAPLEHFQQTQQDNCCINVVDVSLTDPRDAQVHIVNWRPQHDAPGAGDATSAVAKADSKV